MIDPVREKEKGEKRSLLEHLRGILDK